MHFEGVPIKYSKQFLYYIEIICKMVCEKKVQDWIPYLWLISRPPKCGCSFGKFTLEQVLKSLSVKNNSLKPPVFGDVLIKCSK